MSGNASALQDIEERENEESDVEGRSRRVDGQGLCVSSSAGVLSAAPQPLPKNVSWQQVCCDAQALSNSSRQQTQLAQLHACRNAARGHPIMIELPGWSGQLGGLWCHCERDDQRYISPRHEPHISETSLLDGPPCDPVGVAILHGVPSLVP